ncbi:MAG: hypothetical protein V7K57_07690 [Nostoc sp.]|uniref:hypothetical protein n=1 Tax=Nostoc sp. TaxID=1180 RepID=UPI002FFB7AA1
MMCHKGKQDSVVRVRKQADLDMLELAAATGEIDLKFRRCFRVLCMERTGLHLLL